jgi:hypothetical protein
MHPRLRPLLKMPEPHRMYPGADPNEAVMAALERSCRRSIPPPKKAIKPATCPKFD